LDFGTGQLTPHIEETESQWCASLLRNTEWSGMEPEARGDSERLFVAVRVLGARQNSLDIL